MKATTVSLVLLGMLWAGTGSAAPQKHSADFLFRQLRSPFERKLKGTRRGCSAYGHSCFGGYGKRAGGGGGALPLVAPPPPHQLRGQQQAEPQPDAGDDADLSRPERLPYLRSLRSPQDDEEAAFVVLRQSPVASRTPMWGRPAAASATRTYRGDEDDDAEAVATAGGGVIPASDRRAGSTEDTDVAEPYANMASRLFLRRWLRTYRRAGERGSRSSARK